MTRRSSTPDVPHPFPGRYRRRWRAGSPARPTSGIGQTNGDRGSAAAELTLLAPVFLLLLLAIVAGGRLVDTQTQLTQAASSAARAASLTRAPATGTRAAERSAADALADANNCEDLRVEVDTNAFRPGGTVTVRVSCRVGLDTLTGSRLPGTRTLSAASTAPLDRFRAIQP